MKKTFTSAALICSLLIACNNNTQNTNGQDGSTPEAEKKISKRVCVSK